MTRRVIERYPYAYGMLEAMLEFAISELERSDRAQSPVVAYLREAQDRAHAIVETGIIPGLDEAAPDPEQV